MTALDLMAYAVVIYLGIALVAGLVGAAIIIPIIIRNRRRTVEEMKKRRVETIIRHEKERFKL